LDFARSGLRQGNPQTANGYGDLGKSGCKVEKVTEPSRLRLALRVAGIRIDQEFERINVEGVFVNLKRFLLGSQNGLIGRFAPSR
jgi:hypothetical protein